MSGDDMRAAAERLTDGRFTLADWQGPTGDCADMRAAIVLARAYLAEHPADDGEAVTEEWLRSVGFVESANDAWVWARATGVGVALAVRRDLSEFQLCSPTDDYDNVTIAPPPTRGHVRRLLAALGITSGAES